MDNAASPPGLVEHFFRHEYGRLISGLVRRYGAARLELIEDAAQSALVAAVSTWARGGIPKNPAAWLTRVAKNRVIDELRRAHAGDEPLDEESPAPSEPPPSGATGFPEQIFDDELRMLFVCCDESIKSRMQLVLALKLLCGFSTQEIAARLFLSESNVQKLLERGRSNLRANYDPVEREWAEPGSPTIKARAPAVLRVIYLLFNEGYSSLESDRVIRRELCQEALRLGEIMARHPVAGCPEADALMALMLLHFARLDARLDDTGGLLLLEQQDRDRWDRALIAQGIHFLWKSGRGEVFSRYHAQAAILAEHCMAPSFEQTNFQEIVELYEALERVEPSPLHTLNRAIALAEWQGPQAGLELLALMKPPAWLLGYYLWDGTQGELLRRHGDFEQACVFLKRALESAPTEAEKRVFQRKLELAEAKVKG